MALRLVCCALLWSAATASAQLARPTACSDCIAGWFYFDHDAAGAAQDWNCGASSYDGHRGSDFSLRGGNPAIAAGHDVVAAADGVVQRAQDGFFDQCSACGGTDCGLDFGFGYGNHLVIAHEGVDVVYAHMRMGSVRVGVGERVTCGQVIGQIASSGCSTGAHLHFETRAPSAASRDAYDPFVGGCSEGPGRWLAQGDYRSLPGAVCPEPPPMCPAGTSADWSCEGAERVRCVDGVVTREVCPIGCEPGAPDAICTEPPECPPGIGPTWSCDGMERVSCVDGVVSREGCVLGCDGSEEVATCRTPVDAGLDGGRDAGTDGGDARSTLSGGCSCRAGSDGSSGGFWVAAALICAVLVRRRE